MPITRNALQSLPDLSSLRIACIFRFEFKMVSMLEALLHRRAALFNITCNPTTVHGEQYHRAQ